MKITTKKYNCSIRDYDKRKVFSRYSVKMYPPPVKLICQCAYFLKMKLTVLLSAENRTLWIVLSHTCRNRWVSSHQGVRMESVVLLGHHPHLIWKNKKLQKSSY